MEREIWREEEVENWPCWWWRIGKKVLMAGVVISSAPVVLPPLIVVSALGFAASLPFAAVFATYACTNNLMAKLLTTKTHHHHDQQHVNYIDSALAPAHDVEKNHLIQEEEEEKMSHDEELYRINEIELVEDIDREEEGRERESHYDNIDFDEEKEKQIMSDSSDDEESAEMKQQSAEDIILMNADDAAAPPPQKHDDDDDDDDANKETNKETVIVHHHHIIHTDADAAAEEDQQQEQEEDVVTIISGEAKDAAGDSRSELKEEEKQSVQVANGDGDDHSSLGLIGDEEKIWEKINAIRGIVGFKAPRRSSYDQELKALYLFTGIEPPPLSSTTSFHDNLCFLMSVIGLK